MARARAQAEMTALVVPPADAPQSTESRCSRACPPTRVRCACRESALTRWLEVVGMPEEVP